MVFFSRTKSFSISFFLFRRSRGSGRPCLSCTCCVYMQTHKQVYLAKKRLATQHISMDNNVHTQCVFCIVVESIGGCVLFSPFLPSLKTGLNCMKISSNSAVARVHCRTHTHTHTHTHTRMHAYLDLPPTFTPPISFSLPLLLFSLFIHAYRPVHRIPIYQAVENTPRSPCT